MSKELREWTGKCKMLEEMRNNIQSTLDEKTDVEQSLLRENRELTIQLEKLQVGTCSCVIICCEEINSP